MSTEQVGSQVSAERMATGVTWMGCGTAVLLLVLFIGRDRMYATLALLLVLIGTTNREGGPVTVRAALWHSAWTAAIFIVGSYLSRAVGLPSW